MRERKRDLEREGERQSERERGREGGYSIETQQILNNFYTY